MSEILSRPETNECRKSRVTPIALIIVGLVHAKAYAEQVTQLAPEIEKVEVKGDSNRQSIAGKVAVERSEIVKYGDTSLSDVLKRLPGVTVNAGGISLRGLGNGYTQILLNGDAVPPGFSIESISPDLIERIEIMRTASADVSTQAIAGTINVVLRKVVSESQTEVKIAADGNNAGVHPNLTIQKTDRRDAFSYSVVGVAYRKKSEEPQTILERTDANGQLRNLRLTVQDNDEVADVISLTPRMNWKWDNGDVLSIQTYIEKRRTKFDTINRESLIAGDSSTYPFNTERGASDILTTRSDLSWDHRFSALGKLSVKIGANYNKRDNTYRFDGTPAVSTESAVRTVLSDANDNSLTSTGKLLTPVVGGHSISLGWDAAHAQRGEHRLQRDLNDRGEMAETLNEAYDATVRKLALYVQDNWDVSKDFQVYAGVRWEYLGTESLSREAREVRNSSTVWSPVLQSMWEVLGGDQVRLSLARTYKAPATANLMPRRFVINNNNNPTTPDRQGNPNLRPELAWGLDVTYEHRFEKSYSASINAYTRYIDDVTVQQLMQDGSTWVSTPANAGKARAQGVSVEMKFPLRYWLAAARNIDVRFDLSRNWSSVDAVHKPNNRLTQQVPLSTNLGLEYQPGGALSAGANFGFRRGGLTNTSDVLSYYAGSSRTLDTYLVWKMRPKMKLRLALNNILHPDSRSAIAYADVSTGVLRSYVTPTHTTLKAALEIQL
ncbi:TonB-dependent siderophore receptor [Massilia sp. BJB1822]|uniref:TonB-dependent receptor plug domain-containing protein n=1 Tax=Massilia sp. BJB1822 TaxID=2744470 RepID=UPI0015942BA7|nr:TonB-dependent receptor [Massilia sp. BJB1822]NVE01272.1 TonB-dependent receptor [Massilia sp. BJB1822]